MAFLLDCCGTCADAFWRYMPSPENLPDADDFEQDDLAEQMRMLIHVSEALRAETAQLIEQLKLTLAEMNRVRERHRLN